MFSKHHPTMGTNGCFLVGFTIVAVYVSQTTVESTITSNFRAIHHKSSKLANTDDVTVFIHR